MSIATESFRIEPVARRIRAVLNGQVVLDTTDARLLFEPRRIPSYLFPQTALDPQRLVPSKTQTTDRLKGPVRHWSVQVDDRIAADAVAAYPDAEPPELDGLVSVKWNAMDQWYEEDQEVFSHARNPYHRVDALPSSRHVQVFADGIKIADSHRPIIVYETDMPPRYYLPKLDVRMDRLEKVEQKTSCPYKGWAGYYILDTGERVHKMRVWEYASPLPEVAPIVGHLAFYQEKLEVRVDGVKV